MPQRNLMYVRETYNRFHELSFVLCCSGKDPVTGRNKVYKKTFKVPSDVTGKKQTEAFCLQCQLQWKEEVARKSKCTEPIHADMPFIQFAEEYIENILKTNPEAYHYYRTEREYLKEVKPFLAKYKLSEITQPVVQNFCNWLNARKYKKTTVTVIKSLRPILRERGLTQTAICHACAISESALNRTLNVGARSSQTTAQTLCRQLGVPLSEYFSVKTAEVPYSRSCNNNLRTFLHGVLQEAVRKNLIAVNYASKEYVRPLKGTTRSKPIIDSEGEWTKVLTCLQQTTDLRKKTAFALYLYLGLRNAEVAGLSWADVDLAKQELSIRHNTMYVAGFGTVTKGTKSANSKRTLSMPQALTRILTDYKAWWDTEKERHGDLWAATDKLFVRENGKDMNGTTLAAWLDSWQRENGLKHVTPHGIRHSNITLAIANGIDIKTVSARAGHSDIQTTLNIYSHCIKEADKEAAERIDKLLQI